VPQEAWGWGLTSKSGGPMPAVAMPSPVGKEQVLDSPPVSTTTYGKSNFIVIKIKESSLRGAKKRTG